jgi:polysaccharide export outer membrane protein
MFAKTARFLLLLALVVTAFALAADDDYVIGPGDVLQITVYDEPDLERVVTVQNDGAISFPLVRSIGVGGLTVQQAEQALEKKLGDFLVEPQVTITVKEYRAQMVYVLGAVNKPGAYPLTRRTTVLEIISLAGGIAPDGSKRILLLRGGGNPAGAQQMLEQSGGVADEQRLQQAINAPTPPIVIDGQRLLDEGDTSQNLVLRGGDVIYVPKAKLVYVLGEVRRPGGVPFTDGLTVIQAISLAGGTTEMAADAIVVTRKVEGAEQRFKLDYAHILRDSSLDLRLEANDVIVVKRRIF